MNSFNHFNLIRHLAMLKLYRMAKQSHTETDLVPCEREQIPHCLAEVVHFANGNR